MLKTTTIADISVYSKRSTLLGYRREYIFIEYTQQQVAQINLMRNCFCFDRET